MWGDTRAVLTVASPYCLQHQVHSGEPAGTEEPPPAAGPGLATGGPHAGQGGGGVEGGGGV